MWNKTDLPNGLLPPGNIQTPLERSVNDFGETVCFLQESNWDVLMKTHESYCSVDWCYFFPKTAPRKSGIPRKTNGAASNKISHLSAHAALSLLKTSVPWVFPYLYFSPTNVLGAFVLSGILHKISLQSFTWQSCLYDYDLATGAKQLGRPF